MRDRLLKQANREYDPRQWLLAGGRWSLEHD